MRIKTLLAAAALVTTAALPSISYADVAYNVGVVTDYRYRGISQTRLKPALQGGVDWSDGPFYVGAWASTIKWIKDAGGGANLELDLYGGYKGEIAKDVGFDVGYLRYEYVGNKLGNVPGFANANTDELYGALTFGPVTAKYSHSVSNLFGFVNSKNSGYLDISATFDLGDGWSLTPHIGHQRVKNNGAFSYTDYAITATKDLGNGLSASVGLVGTDADKALYVTPSGKFTGKNAVVAGLKYSF